MSKDLHNNIEPARALDPVVVTDNTAQVSQIVDTANFHSVELLILTGTLSDADTTVTLLIEEGNQSNLSDAAAVADADLLGTEAGVNLTFAADSKVMKIGYTGSKRYLRATATPANNTGNIPIAMAWLKGNPRKGPRTSQQV